MSSFVTSLAVLPVLYATVGTIAGITHRVAQLLEALEELEVCTWHTARSYCTLLLPMEVAPNWCPLPSTAAELETKDPSSLSLRLLG